jgi:hypothetical protein
MKKGINVYILMLILLSSCAPVPVSEEKPPQETNNIAYEFIYVSITGNDTNSGIVTNSPLRSLPAAAAKAAASGSTNILVTSGVFSPGAGLNSTTNGVLIADTDKMRITGGYDTNFIDHSGITILDGANTLYHVVSIENVQGILLDGFIIMQGRANGGSDHSKGGGIYIINSSSVKITNCIVSNNSATFDGGGIYVYGSGGTAIDGVISGNTANCGGGIYLCYSGGYSIGGTIYSNTANDGGGVYIYGGNSNIITGIITGNLSTNFGGGVYIEGGFNHIINCLVSNNTSLNSGGGVYFNGGNDFSITGIIADNDTDYAGGGIYMGNGAGHIISGSVTGNTADTIGGGLLLTMGYSFSLNGLVSGNNAVYGGGIYMGNGTNHIISGIISGNNASLYGGGIYLIDTGIEHTFSATIKSNANYGIYTNASSNPMLSNVTWGVGAVTNMPADVGP